MIYLASPYSDPDPAVRHNRYALAVRETARFWREGYTVFSPIAHSHPIALHGLDGSWEQWAEFDETIIAVCSELWVLTLPGWTESRGIEAEIAIAFAHGIPVKHVAPMTVAVPA